MLDTCSIPIAVVMGNHDAFGSSVEEFFSVLGEKYMPTDRVVEGKTLIFIDACYNSDGTHYKRGDHDCTDTNYFKVAQLKSALDKASGEVFIFMHQNLDLGISADHRLRNDQEIREILENSGKVKTVYQGHYHYGNESYHNNIRYKTFYATCEHDDAVFIEEI